MGFKKKNSDCVQSVAADTTLSGALRPSLSDGGNKPKTCGCHVSVVLLQGTTKTVNIPWSRPWSDVVATYATWSGVPDPKIMTLRKSYRDLDALVVALTTATGDLRAGDVVALDIAGKTGQGQGVTRDEVGRALFRAGFENSLVWAGRDVLRAERRPVSVLGALLPSSALGAGERHLPGISGELVPPGDRLFCLARRSPLPRPAERQLTLSVVMPVYNEKSTFRIVMEKLLSKRMTGVDIEVYVVESNSKDGTREDVLAYEGHPQVRVLLEDKPSGKGHAVRMGLRMARGDILLIQDADLEYDLDDYEKLIAPIRAGEASFILGSRHPAGEKLWKIRKFDGAVHLADVMNVGHLFFTWLINTVFEQTLRDPFTMYKVFRRDCIYGLRFDCDRFDFDHEIVGKLVRNGFNPIEIDVSYHCRSFAEGKKISIFGDPPTWISACLKHRFSQLHEWPVAAVQPVAMVTPQQEKA